MTGFMERDGENLIVKVHVQPKSSKIAWGDVIEHDGRVWIRLKIASPPVEGAANKEAVKFLAKEFKTAKSNIQIVQGEKSRYKTFRIGSFNEDRLQSFAQENDCTID